MTTFNEMKQRMVMRRVLDLGNRPAKPKDFLVAEITNFPLFSGMVLDSFLRAVARLLCQLEEGGMVQRTDQGFVSTKEGKRWASEW